MRIGSILGIPLFINSSWFLLLALVTLINAMNLYPAFGGAIALTVGLLMALLLFSSVLLHELGHSIVARSQGIQVNSISLFLFGGVASIDTESKTPGKAFQVAIAGPAVSLGLFALFSLLLTFIPPESVLEIVAFDLARINLILALFNLIPGLPLDGGQVLKAAVWKATGNRHTGVKWASQTGKAIGVGAIAIGLFLLLFRQEFGAIWIALIGGFIFRNANSYDRFTTLQEILLKLAAADAMTRDYRVVDANLTLRDFTQDYILTDTQKPMPYFAVSEGRYRGLVAVEDLQFIERSQWDIQTLDSIVHPLTEIPTVAEKTTLAEVINTLETKSLTRLTVLSPAGTIAGVIDKSDIVRIVASKLNLPISEVEIKRVKTEGTYPDGLKLDAIAKSLNN